jgi:hypothetical protein
MVSVHAPSRWSVIDWEGCHTRYLMRRAVAVSNQMLTVAGAS